MPINWTLLVSVKVACTHLTHVTGVEQVEVDLPLVVSDGASSQNRPITNQCGSKKKKKSIFETAIANRKQNKTECCKK